jgi:hypothetical protein
MGASRWLTLASGASPPATVTVQAAPSGFVDGPAPGATVSGTVYLTGWATVTGSTISRVEVYLDGRWQGNAQYGLYRPDAGGHYGFSWAWNTGLSGNGSHSLQLRAVAATGVASWLPVSASPHPTAIPLIIAGAVQQGDADGDGRVDGVDYAVWLSHAGSVTSNGAADGDFDGDGQVDDHDYEIWSENFDG